jgi:hypothetical protein
VTRRAYLEADARLCRIEIQRRRARLWEHVHSRILALTIRRVYASAEAAKNHELTFKQQHPQLTLSQKLQKTLAEKQDRENQRKADLNKRNMEIITTFIVEYIEPLLEAQALSGLSKTVYKFIPSGTEQGELAKIIPENVDIVEGFGGSDTATHYIENYSRKEYLKIVRLIRKEYSLEFWQQPRVVEELEQTLKLRLKATGEKVADATPDTAGEWSWSSDGGTLSPGYTGIALLLHTSLYNAKVTFVELYAEIT